MKSRAARRSELAQAKTKEEAEALQLLRVQRLIAEELLVNRDVLDAAARASKRVEEWSNGQAAEAPEAKTAIAALKANYAHAQWDALKPELSTMPGEQWLAVQTACHGRQGLSETMNRRMKLSPRSCMNSSWRRLAPSMPLTRSCT